MPNGDLFTLEQAASEVAGYLPLENESSAKGAYGIDFASIIAILLPILTDLLANCSRPPETVAEMARSRRKNVRDLVYQECHSQVSATYSWFGRLFYGGRIRRTANDLTQATLDASENLTSDRAESLMTAAKAMKGQG